MKSFNMYINGIGSMYLLICLYNVLRPTENLQLGIRYDPKTPRMDTHGSSKELHRDML
jgi:hypothetical protein